MKGSKKRWAWGGQRVLVGTKTWLVLNIEAPCVVGLSLLNSVDALDLCHLCFHRGSRCIQPLSTNL